MPAVDVHLRTDKITRLDRRDFVSHAFDVSTKLMSERQRRLDAPLRPTVPSVNMQVRPANGSGLHADQHVGRTNRRHRDRVHLQAPRGLHLPQRFHSCCHLLEPSFDTQAFDANTPPLFRLWRGGMLRTDAYPHFNVIRDGRSDHGAVATHLGRRDTVILELSLVGFLSPLARKFDTYP